MSPAVLNTLSEGTQVAGIHNLHLAISASNGKKMELSFHQVRGSKFTGMLGVALYRLTSSAAMSSRIFSPFSSLYVKDTTKMYTPFLIGFN